MVRRAEVGHDEQVVYVNAVGTAHGKDSVKPLAGCDLAGRGDPELFGRNGLPRAVGAPSHADEHDAAVGRHPHLDVYVLGLPGQGKGLLQGYHGAEGVAAEARTLCAEHLCRGIGGKAQNGVDRCIGIGSDLYVALSFQLAAGAEG